MDDAGIAALVGSSRATAFASIAEGCGLPLLESLWMGVPCVCSDIASVAENASGGGCSIITGNSPQEWTAGLRLILEDDALHGRLASEASARDLPTWAASAAMLREALA
jgi:glycosyltransferase involved in cell wall biosynthesis